MRPTAVPAALLAWACASADAPAAGVARHDSLGVAIVENASPAWPNGAAWILVGIWRDRDDVAYVRLHRLIK